VQGSRARINCKDRSGPGGFAHSFDDEHGRMNWQKASGYNRRSKVEAAIGRYKRLIGDALRSRKDARRVCEVKIVVKALNRMLELGRGICVRVA
jgi:hypothetical protein